MSRFADPRRTATLALPGGCQCPGSPHEADEWVYRTELGDSEIKQAGARAVTSAADLGINLVLMQDLLLETATVSWNLVDENGPVTVSRNAIGLLDGATRDAMLEALDAATTKSLAPPPNGFAVRSPNGSRANGSRTRTATKAR